MLPANGHFERRLFHGEDRNWTHLFSLIEDGIRHLAADANIPHQELRQRYVTACLHISSPNEVNRAKKDEALDVKYRNQHHSLLKTARNLRPEYTKVYPTNDSSKSQRPVTKGFVKSDMNPSPQLGVTCASGSQRTNPRLTQMPLRTQLSVPKFYCDIEAALAGELSDSQEDHEGTNNMQNKSANNCKKSRSKNILRKDITVHSNPEWHSETRIIQYPSLAPLPLNVLHKVYVVHLEDRFVWVRLLDGKRPICFNATDESLKDEHPLSVEDIIPSAPCAVFASFKPLDIVNDGLVREPTEIKCYARGVVEKTFKDTRKATVRLVDFGFCLTNVDFMDIKPLAIVHDGPPLALRLHMDSLDEEQKRAVKQYATVGVRLTLESDASSLRWMRTWKVLEVQRQNWHEESGSMVNSNPESVQVTSEAAKCSHGTVTRAFVFSWLNKQHKRAGGIGLQAALSNIIGCSSDVLPPAATITEARPGESEKLKAVPVSMQSVQPSDDLPKLAKQTIPQKYGNATDKEVDENWPPLNDPMRRTNGKAPLFSRKKETRRGGNGS